MGIHCAHCEVSICGGVNEFIKHVSNKFHSKVYICTEGDCVRRKYQSAQTSKRHLALHHAELCHDGDADAGSDTASENSTHSNGSAESAGIPDNGCNIYDGGEGGESSAESSEVELEPVTEPDPQSEEDDNDFNVDLERSSALYILNLKKRGNVP